MNFFGKRIIFFAKMYQLGEFGLQQFDFLARGDQLALRDGYRAATVRVYDVDVEQHIHVLLKKIRVRSQEFGDLFGA